MFTTLVLIPALLFDIIAEDEEIRTGGTRISMEEAYNIATDTHRLGEHLHPEGDEHRQPITDELLVHWWEEREESELKKSYPS